MHEEEYEEVQRYFFPTRSVFVMNTGRYNPEETIWEPEKKVRRARAGFAFEKHLVFENCSVGKRKTPVHL